MFEIGIPKIILVEIGLATVGHCATTGCKDVKDVMLGSKSLSTKSIKIDQDDRGRRK